MVGRAALRGRLRPRRDEIEKWQTVAHGPPIPENFGERRTIRAACSDLERAERQRRFRLLLLRRAYPLAHWLPPEAVLHLARVDLDPEGTRLLLTLVTGTKIMDTGDRIVLQGRPDDVAVEEMAACVERRRWPLVEVSGDEQFRTEMSRQLMLRGVEVVDCPLPAAEQAELMRQAGGFDWREVDEPPAPLPVPVPPWATEIA